MTQEVGQLGRTVNEIALELGCDWHAINDTIVAYGTPLIEDPARIGEPIALGLDETLFCRVGKWRRQSWSTSIVDVSSSDPSRRGRHVDRERSPQLAVVKVQGEVAHPDDAVLASAGSVHFEGRDITSTSPERLVGQGLLLVPGGRAVFADMTVAENLEMQALLARRSGSLRERRAAVLETFPRLGERLGVPAGRLSGGEQQQLALAKAMLLDPALLCIDELSLGLAPVVVQELLEVVRRINAAGVAIVLVEQSLNIAAALCERSVFLEKGGVRFEGRTAELLERDDVARAVFLGEAAAAAASGH